MLLPALRLFEKSFGKNFHSASPLLRVVSAGFRRRFLPVGPLSGFLKKASAKTSTPAFFEKKAWPRNFHSALPPLRVVSAGFRAGASSRAVPGGSRSGFLEKASAKTSIPAFFKKKAWPRNFSGFLKKASSPPFLEKRLGQKTFTRLRRLPAF